MSLDLTGKFNSAWNSASTTLNVAANTVEHTLATADQYAVSALLDKAHENANEYGTDYVQQVDDIMSIYR